MARTALVVFSTGNYFKVKTLNLYKSVSERYRTYHRLVDTNGVRDFVAPRMKIQSIEQQQWWERQSFFWLSRSGQVCLVKGLGNKERQRDRRVRATGALYRACILAFLVGNPYPAGRFVLVLYNSPMDATSIMISPILCIRLVFSCRRAYLLLSLEMRALIIFHLWSNPHHAKVS